MRAWTRMTCGSGPAAGHGPGPGGGPPTRSADEGFVAAVDRGRYGCSSGTARSPRCRPRTRAPQVVVGDRVRAGRGHLRRAGHAGPGGPGRAPARPCCAAPPTTPTRWSGSSWPTPNQLVIVMRAGRSAAPAPAHRPVPGRRLRRGAGPAALPDQVRPGPAGRDPGRLRPLGLRHVVTGRGSGGEVTLGPLRERAGRAAQRARRALGGRQVDAGEHPDPGGRAGGGHGQPGDRPGPPHLIVGRRVPAARRRLAHRHPGAARVRPGPHLRRTGSSRPSPTWPRASRPAREGAPTSRTAARLDEWVAEHDSSGALAARLDSLRRLLTSREDSELG